MKLSKKTISNILLIVFIVALVYYVSQNASDFEALLSVNPWYLVAVFILRSSQLLLSGWFIQIITNLFLKEKKLAVLESFYISVFSAVGNFFSFLQGGVGIRAVYLKDKYNLALSDFSITVLIHYAILFFIYGSMGILGLWFLGNINWYLMLPMFGMAYGTIFALLFFKIIPVSKLVPKIPFAFLRNTLINLEALPGLILRHLSLFSILGLLYLLRFTIACLIQFLFFKSIDIEVEIANLFLYTAISGLSIIINLTPASIGFREGLFILVEDSLGLTTSEILNLAILDRSVLVLVLVVLFFILRYIQNKNVQE